MKFLCEQCKAKYQIADDKVAGKTVRMKCRKCGHMIEVRAEVTETSVSRGLPVEVSMSEASDVAAMSSGSVAPKVAAKPQKPPPPRGSSLSTSLNKPPPPRGTAPRGPAKSVTSASMAGKAPASAPPSALAGAFQKSVAKENPSLLDLSGSKEWYVAINGVPVGPVRVAELRRKAALGSVGDDSLVWQEGMEEWRPVKAIAELAALVREAAQSGRPSLAAPQPDGRSSQPPPSVAPKPAPRPATRGVPPRPPSAPEAFKPVPVASATARSNVVPFAPRSAPDEKLEADPTDIAVIALPEPEPAAPSPLAAAAPPDANPLGLGDRPSFSSPDPFAAPPAASGAALASPLGATGPAMHTSQSMSGPAPSVAIGPPILATEAPPARRKEVPWIPLAMVVLAGAFGITAAVFIFRQPQAPVAPTAPSATAPVASATTPPPIPPPPPAESVAEENPAPAASGKVAAKPGATAKPTTPVAANTGAKPVDLGGLIGSGSGPSSGSGGSAGNSGGSSLSEDQIRSVLNQHSLSVRRNCWERGGSQQSSVAVTATIRVSGSGNVSSVSADGNDPAVSKCIENAIRGWQFPATGGQSTVKIPFKFVRQ